MRILVDMYGGDNAPSAVLEGVALAISRNSSIALTLVGCEAELRKLITDSNALEHCEFVEAKSVIGNDEIPTLAVRDKPDATVVVGMSALRHSEDLGVFVSAGSTGALIASGVMKLGRIQGAQRPALAPILPTLTGGGCMLIDCGANADCTPSMLLGFGIMGAKYMENVLGIQRPRVALLSNGTEDKKGNELTHAAFELLKDADLNFVGNMEARDILSGNYDVVVSDGFSGNIALKSIEGAAGSIFSSLKTAINGGGLRAKLGALLLKPALKQVKNTLDYNKRGGAVLLGLKKPVIKAHGASGGEAFCSAILQAQSLIDADFTASLEHSLVQE